MAQLIRRGGLTTFTDGSVVIVTNVINRFRFNDLRKKPDLSERDVLRAIENASG